LADPRRRKDKAALSIADAAAEMVNQLVIGAPLCNPLLKDAKERLARMRQLLDIHASSLRHVDDPEICALGLSLSGRYYRPDIQPLGRPATAADVAGGKAVFHLAGKGKPTLKALATAILKRDRDRKDPPRVLLVQGETAPDGTTYYGIIGRYEMRRVAADHLADVKPVNMNRSIERLLP
ncbi:hypothetical protein LCGC14_2166580, partial [marine sediment metagenome]